MVHTIRSGARVARGATYLFIQGIISAVISVAYFAILARFFPPPRPEMGVYAILTFIITLVQVFGTFALELASTKYIAQYTTEGASKKAKSVVARALQFSLIASAILSMLFFASAEWLSTLLLGTSKWAPLFRILAFAAFFKILFTQTLGFLQGLQRIREMAAINLAYTVMEKVLAIYLLYAGWELFGVIYSWLMGLILCSLIGLILTARFLGILEKPHPAKPLINFSYPLYVSGILAFAVNWIDQLFILPYMGVVYLGMYHIATKAALVPSLISSSIFVALFPKLSELYTRGGADSLKEAFHVTTRYVVMAGFPVIVGLAVLAYPAIVLFAGVEYAEAALPLTILCLAQLPVTLGVAISPTLMTLERTKTRLMLNVAYILFETFMSYIALAHLNLGMPGAGWARVFTGLIGFGLAVYALRRTLNITLDKEALWKASAASIIMAAGIALLETPIFQLYLLPLYLVLPLLMIVGSVTYFLSLVALRAIKKRDVELIHDYLPKGLKHIAFWLGRVAFVE